MILHEFLEELINSKKKLIGKDAVIEEEYSICRSLKKGSTTQARNIVVSDLDIATANIWRNTERTGGIRATKNMVEHYSQIQILFPTLIRYY